MITKHKPCKHCTSERHTSFQCPTKRKALSPKGKQAAAWYKTKVAWSKKHGAEHYTCHYCGTHLTQATVTLDHLIPRSLAPELRHDFNNLVPCCWNCNGLKGSLAHDDYKHDCHTALALV